MGFLWTELSLQFTRNHRRACVVLTKCMHVRTVDNLRERLPLAISLWTSRRDILAMDCAIPVHGRSVVDNHRQQSSLTAQRQSDPLVKRRTSALHPHLGEDIRPAYLR